MKIKLPKRFYTPDQLAERWECKVEEINHLIETNELETVDKGAAREGKKHLRPLIFYDWDAYEALEEDEEFTSELIIPIVDSPTCDLSDEEILKSEIGLLVDAGELDQVISDEEVLRFEREHSKTRTTDGVSVRTEITYLNIIGGLLSLLLDKSPTGKPQSVFENQSAVISALLGHYGHVKGMGDSNLEKTLAKAKKTLKDSQIPGG